MIYNQFKNIKLSSLGMGCMRLPTIPETKQIDMAKTKEMIAYAMSNGVNYYDTAWGYHDGKSEPVMGEILSEYPRDSFYLASKFPGYDVSNFGKIEQIFPKQLERCRVEYFDFYLFHNVCEANIEQYLNPEYRTAEYIKARKADGKIKHIGFSMHATLDTVKRFLEAYGDIIEFAQVQLNWLDWDFQDAKAKVELLNSLQIPIWVMEPVRGGKLCNIAPKYQKALAALAPERTLPEWCFRYLQSISGVTLTLSGMSSFEQLRQNIETFSTNEPLSEAEIKTLYGIARNMTSIGTVPCTACGYCTEHCPMSLEIPRLIELYNEHVYTEDGFIAPMAISALPEDKKPSACIGCRACEALCPQTIKISEIMKSFAKALS